MRRRRYHIMSNFERINGCLDEINSEAYEDALRTLSDGSNGDTVDVAYCNLGQRAIKMSRSNKTVDVDVKSFNGHTIIHSSFDYKNGDYATKAAEIKGCVDGALKCSKTNIPSICLV